MHSKQKARMLICIKLSFSTRPTIEAFLQLTFLRSTSWLQIRFSCPNCRYGIFLTTPSIIFLLLTTQKQILRNIGKDWSHPFLSNWILELQGPACMEHVSHWCAVYVSSIFFSCSGVLDSNSLCTPKCNHARNTWSLNAFECTKNPVHKYYK